MVSTSIGSLQLSILTFTAHPISPVDRKLTHDLKREVGVGDLRRVRREVQSEQQTPVLHLIFCELRPTRSASGQVYKKCPPCVSEHMET
jgi:hypothetical protein